MTFEISLSLFEANSAGARGVSLLELYVMGNWPHKKCVMFRVLVAISLASDNHEELMTAWGCPPKID